MTERQPNHHPQPGELPRPSQLSPELTEFLCGQHIAAVFDRIVDLGTVMVVKAPAREIRSVQGPVPIELRHELPQHQAAPVVRVVTTIYDRPDAPLKLETFVNVGDLHPRADYAALAEQDELLMISYDEGLTHSLTKLVRGIVPGAIAQVLAEADRELARIPPERRNFDQAKADVMEATEL
jgi:hypothetical protein